MVRTRSIGQLFVIAVALVFVGNAAPTQSQAGLERKILLRYDLPTPGYETLLVEVTLAVGAREGRHTHPGTFLGYVLEGELTLEVDGQPPKILKAGDSIAIEPRRVHEGVNKGNVPVKALATLIVEKGQPLSTPF